MISKDLLRGAFRALRAGMFLLSLGPLVASGLAAAPATPPDPASGLDHVRLQLKWTHQFQFAGYYAAVEQGYYRDAGLDVKLIEATPEMDPTAEVLQGKADFGVGTSDLMLLRAQGKPVVVLGVVYQHSPLLLVARHDAGINDIHDLVGKPIMIEPGSADIYAYFRNEGVDAEKLQVVPHTFDPRTLIDGKVAAMSAYSTDEPFTLRAAGLDFLEFTPRAGGVDFYGDNLFTTERQLRDHPDRVRAFRAASLRGWSYAVAHSDAMIDLIGKKYNRGRSREQLAFEAEETKRLMHADLIEVGYMNPGRWRHIQETYTDLGMLPSSFSLKGFLYDPNPKPDLRLLYGLLIGAAALAAAAIFWLLPLIHLNRKLRHEIGRRSVVEKQLRKSEKQYRELAEAAPFPVVISDLADSRVLYANPRAVEMLGIPAGLSAQPLGNDFYTDPQKREALFEDLRHRRKAVDREIGLKRIDGRLIWTLMSAGVIEFDGQPAVLSSFNDITQRRNMESELQRAKETAEGAYAAKSHYLAVMSHEVRSPIGGIAQLLKMILSDDAVLPDAVRDDLSMIEVSARSLHQMLDELLEWSRAESGQVQLESERINLSAFLEELRSLFMPAAGIKKVALGCVVAPGTPSVVLSDPMRLRQILSNLFANAVKFTESGAVTVSVEKVALAAKVTPGICRLRFKVTDSGMGIPEEGLIQLFEPYRQADASIARRFGGSGLGLSISLHLARLMGGDITVESEVGKGSVFTLEIVVQMPAGE